VPSSIISENVFTSRPAFSGFARITRYDDWGLDLSGQQKVIDMLTLKAKLFYHDHVDDYTSFSDQTYTNEIAVSRYKDYLLGGSLSSDFRPVSWDIIRLSLQYRGDSHKERDDTYLPFAETFSLTGSAGLENEFNYIKNLSVVAGASYDWFKVTDAEKNITDSSTGNFLRQDKIHKPGYMNEFNPMIGATYTFEDTTRLFGSLARKVRFPTLQQLFSSKGGNTDLDAERSINYTLGAARSFDEYANAELAFFYHDISDFISRDAPGTEGKYQNFAKIELLGFELSGSVNPIKNLIFWAGYTYKYARDRSSDRVTDKVTYMPQHEVDASIEYLVPYIDTKIDLVSVYVSKFYSQLPSPQKPTQSSLKGGEQFIFNTRISKSFLKHFEAYLAVNNIFDSDYESEVGFPGPGRNFYVGISAKL
jgi:outer membrane receptor protein involved in Fe transport